MDRAFRQLKYDPPEKFGDDARIGHGEAVSMITDLLVQTQKHCFLHRRVDNNVRYALKIRKLSRAPDKTYQFSQIASWAGHRYGTENPGIRRMRHGATVSVSGVEASSQVGVSRIYGSLEDYKTACKRLTCENERLVSALTESHKQNRILSIAAEIGRKVLEGSARGGQAPKTPQRPLSK